jgi:CBS domain containing-hemolysin-like protein
MVMIKFLTDLFPADPLSEMNAPTEILILILLILTNRLFLLSGMAIISARKVRLQQHAEEGSKDAETAVKVLNRYGDEVLKVYEVGQ